MNQNKKWEENKSKLRNIHRDKRVRETGKQRRANYEPHTHKMINQTDAGCGAETLQKHTMDKVRISGRTYRGRLAREQ